MVGKNLLQGKSDYKDGGVFYGLFLAPEMKYCLTINKYGVIDEHKTFKGFINVSDKVDRKEYFKKFKGDKLVARVPLSWKKSFSVVVVIPHKMGFSSIRMSRSDGGGGWRCLCLKIGYSEPSRAESREGTYTLAESSGVT